MRFVIEPDIRVFAERALPWLLSDPVVNNVAATIVLLRRDGQLVDDQPPLWILAEGGEEIVGTASRTSGWPLLLPAVPIDLAQRLADFLADAAIPLSGVNGPADPAHAFAGRWAELTGCRTSTDRQVRLHRLGRLVQPPAVDGALRPATADDLELCIRWQAEFRQELGGDNPLPTAEAIAGAIDAGSYWIWDSDGCPVSLAGHAPPAARVVRVGPVYTPPEHRRLGYASAATAELSRRLLERADVQNVILYTDLANPTSNAIYHRIGYRPVTDAVELAFPRRPPRRGFSPAKLARQSS